ncbi:VCBS domain-containing protein [Pseudooceanicola sp. CBS1P-1]|uniref:Uncharacterized protein n=1 Tax=Pseudooceanicola albus TaxID=2692189 RepID=A0A6L7G9S5_9RHOB|nr:MULTISPECIES: VCBS domain-containing protein [Pseudooceanicola]MBT9386705.1 VCBS domain-containing protein [Pseudooceanicola endophyticus]MXN20811.1 hypothetical protein [Pseudooceanicola albus]
MFSKIDPHSVSGPSATRADVLRGYQALFRRIHAARARTLSTLAGGLVFLPMALQAQTGPEMIALDGMDEVMSYELLEDGSVRVALVNGQTVLVAASAVTVENGAVLVNAMAWQEMTTVAEIGYMPLIASGLGMSGLIMTAASGGNTNLGTITKLIQVIDAPLENALVFYDRNLDGIPQESEYLGLTDENGALSVSYTPSAGAKFLIIPSPVADAIADYGWSEAFLDSFDGVVTRDVVTESVYGQILSVSDNGAAGTQVASPVSTLIAAGVSAAQVKAVFGLPADLDLDSFNFYEALDSEDPALREAAQKMSAAAVMASKVIDAAVAAASAGGALGTAEQAAVAAQAMADAAKVIAALSGETDLALVTKAASAVAVAGALSEEVDTDALAASLAGAITTGGEDPAAALDAAIDTQLAALPLSTAQQDAVKAVSASLGSSATAVSEFFDGLDDTGTTGADFATTLTDLSDGASEAVNDILAEELLGLDLEADTAEAVEYQSANIKGNVLENDQVVMTDTEGAETSEGLAATARVAAVNGTEVNAVLVESGSGYLHISTANYGLSSLSNGPALSASDDAVTAILGEDTLPAGRDVPGGATETSFSYTTATVSAGQVLSFDYLVSTLDYMPYNDYAYVFVQEVDEDGAPLDEGSYVYLTAEDGLADVETLKGAEYFVGVGEAATQSGSFAYTFDAAGTYRIVIGVADVRDTMVSTSLTVSDIRILDSAGETAEAILLDTLTQVGDVYITGAVSAELNATVVTGMYGTLIIDASGDYTYQVGGSNAEDIAPGEVVVDKFTYTVELADGTQATQTLKIQVTGADEIPEVFSILVVKDADLYDARYSDDVISPYINQEAVSETLIKGYVNNSQGNTVTITVTDVTGATVTGTATVNVYNEYAVTLDLSELAEGALDIAASITFYEGTENEGTYTIHESTILDTILDADNNFAVSVRDQSLDGLTLNLSGINAAAGESASYWIEISGGDGGSTWVSASGITSNGSIGVDFSGVDWSSFLGASVWLSATLSDEAGNAKSTSLDLASAPTVYNQTSDTYFYDLQAALDAAAEGDVLQLGGVTFEGDYTLDKAVTILGNNAGVAAWYMDEDSDTPVYSEDGGSEVGRDAETVFTGTITVAASDVTLDGVLLDGDEPLTWDESLLADSPGALDNFALLNSVMTTYSAANAPSFNAGSDAELGTYTGAAAASGWVISGNLIGGVTSGTGGSLYLSGLSDSTISDNMFWRPAAGHLYVSSLSDTEISDNYFYMGLHADGLVLDRSGQDFTLDEGFVGSDGYGYGAVSDPDAVFFGRNFWLELKGDNDGVTITGNDGAYNSGGIQLYGEAEGYSFDNITISDNTFEDFINADPNGVLIDKSGFMGAISVSIQEGSSGSNIVITGNTITAAEDQVYSAQDSYSLILVQGVATDVTVEDNTITWEATSSDVILEALDHVGVSASTYTGTLVGVTFAGGLSGTLLLSGNSFEDATADTDVALYLVKAIEDFGTLSAAVEASGNDYSDWASYYEGLLSGFETADLEDLDLDITSVLHMQTGTAAADVLSGTADDDVIAGAGGDDEIDFSAGGNDTLLLEADPDDNGEDMVSGFTLGDGAGADRILFADLDHDALRGDGTVAQVVSAGDTVDADAGMLILTTEIAATEGAEEEALAEALSSLEGLEAGDSFYVMVDFSTTDALIGKVTIDETGTDGTAAPLAELLGVTSLAALTQANLPDFILLAEA